MTFGVLLTGTALLVGALNFLPALAIGPIAEHFLMRP
jgi:K+-transporting ATPase ATPase A chain